LREGGAVLCSFIDWFLLLLVARCLLACLVSLSRVSCLSCTCGSMADAPAYGYLIDHCQVLTQRYQGSGFRPRDRSAFVLASPYTSRSTATTPEVADSLTRRIIQAHGQLVRHCFTSSIEPSAATVEIPVDAAVGDTGRLCGKRTREQAAVSDASPSPVQRPDLLAWAASIAAISRFQQRHSIRNSHGDDEDQDEDDNAIVFEDEASTIVPTTTSIDSSELFDRMIRNSSSSRAVRISALSSNTVIIMPPRSAFVMV